MRLHFERRALEDAVCWGCRLQRELLEVQWPEEVLKFETGAEQWCVVDCLRMYGGVCVGGGGGG
jgi:hypothetical protein